MVDTPRMQALAQVAAGIAPALSDLLTVIRGRAGLLLDAAGQDPGARQPLTEIYTAAEKAASLLRQLQIFSRQHEMHPEVVDLNAVIEEAEGVIRCLSGDRISVELRLAATPQLVVADRGMMEQMLIALALNARDAMPSGGRLRFGTETQVIAEDAAKDGRDGRPGRFVVLDVEDNGRGIAPEILPRIFEPFFTTKVGGRSAGLGLAAVFGIVAQHQGWMTVGSVVGGGSSFKATLPAAPPDSIDESGRGSGSPDHKGTETILLVEDDAAVRDFTAVVLKECGYRVLQAASGLDALEAWKWHSTRIRLLLTDMVLEDQMTGLELAAGLRSENPGLKVICISGHRRDDMKCFPGLAGGFHYLEKPCRPQALLAAVRALLDDGRAG